MTNQIIHRFIYIYQSGIQSCAPFSNEISEADIVLYTAARFAEVHVFFFFFYHFPGIKLFIIMFLFYVSSLLYSKKMDHLVFWGVLFIFFLVFFLVFSMYFL